MGDEIGLTIRVKTKGQKGQTEEAARAAAGVKKSLGGMDFSRMVPKSMRGMFSNMMGSLGGSGVGKAAVAGGVAGLAAAGVQGILEILKKMFSLMMESSPMLRAMVRMLNQGFMMILRPFADTIAMMLRPVAMFFRMIGRSVIKRMREKRAELKAKGLSGAALGGALMAEMPGIYLDAIMEILAGVDWATFFDKMLGVLWDNLTQRLPAFIEKVFGYLYDFDAKFWAGVWDAVKGFGEWLYNCITSAIGDLTSTLGGIGTWLYNVITGKIGPMDALKDVATKFYDLFVGVYNFFAGLFNKTFGALGWHIDLLKTSAQLASEALTKAYNNTVTARSGSATNNHAYAYKDRELQYLDSGGDILQTGLAVVHKNEKVLTPEQTAAYNGGGGTLNVSMAIPGSALADAIDRRIDSYFRTKVVARR